MGLATTSFIADADLALYMPDVLTFGVTTFATQNLLATDDVVTRINTEWWPDAVTRRFGLYRENTDTWYRSLPIMDITLLDSALLKGLVVYRALSHYIMPMLSSDSDADGNAFTRRADRHAAFYAEEWEKIVNSPIYDFNSDTTFSQQERKGPPIKRVLRA